MTTAQDFARLVVDEQTAAVRRWGGLWADGAQGLRRLVDREIDGPELGREITEDVVREVVLGLESAARVGLGYSRLVADLVDVPAGEAPTSAPNRVED